MDLPDALALAHRLMDQHGLTQAGWTVGFDRARTRAGVASSSRRWIGLSTELTRLNDADRVRDTILHEIAHALVGTHHGHDATWRATALAIGGSGSRHTDEGTVQPESPWRGVCPAGHEIRRFRTPRGPSSCRRCSPTFDPAALIAWTHHGVPTAPLPATPAAPTASRRRRTARTRTRRPAPTTRPDLVAGTTVVVTSPGRYHGVTGTVEKVARTRYHVRTSAGLLTVPFALARPAR